MMEQYRTTAAEFIEERAILFPGATNPQYPALPAAAPENEFALFFAQSLDLLCVAGLDGRFKRLNPAWTTQLGWTLAELTARPFLDFVHPDDADSTLAELSRLAAGAEVILFENRYRHRNGAYHWLQWNARSAPGRRRIYATARDVTRQKRLEHEIVEIADREKERLGCELHDGLCQSLAGIAALGSTLSRKLAAEFASDASAAAAEITKLLGEAISQARELARGLAPLGLHQTGLPIALETLGCNLSRFRVFCTVECNCPSLGLDDEVEGHLFRIAQEAVNNAVTHGRADRIDIGLRCKKGRGLLSVSDDGVGLPEPASKPDGIGLHTMAYRARQIGGSLEVQRRSGGGTVVVCAFPLPDAPEAGRGRDRVRIRT